MSLNNPCRLGPTRDAPAENREARSAGRSVADREITSLSWERCSGLGARCGDRTRSGRYGLYGLGDGDGEAKRFDLPMRLRSFAVALRVPIIHPCWSGSMPVFVEGAAEPLPSADIEMREPLRISDRSCGCRELHPRHATRRYSLIRPPARACLRTRYCSRSTGWGSGLRGAAACRER